jgi:hypothetical protein
MNQKVQLPALEDFLDEAEGMLVKMAAPKGTKKKCPNRN